MNKYDEIPDVIEQDALPVLAAGIRRIKAMKKPTAQNELHLIKLTTAMTELYIQYRIYRAELKRELAVQSGKAVAIKAA